MVFSHQRFLDLQPAARQLDLIEGSQRVNQLKGDKRIRSKWHYLSQKPVIQP